MEMNGTQCANAFKNYGRLILENLIKSQLQEEHSSHENVTYCMHNRRPRF